MSAVMSSADSGTGVVRRPSMLERFRERRAARSRFGAHAEEYLHLIAAARGGSVSAMRKLGDFVRARKLWAEAESWYEQAAIRDNVPSMMRLVALLDTMNRSDEATAWLRGAAEAGHPDAGLRFGLRCFELCDFTEAQVWLTRAAEAGYVHAYFPLAVVCDEGLDPRSAKVWFARAAAATDLSLQDRRSAKHRLDELRDSKALSPHDAELLAAGEQGDLASLVALGQRAAAAGSLVEAEGVWRRAARGGSAEAMGCLARVRLSRGDAVGAERWWVRAAHAGDTAAMLLLSSALSERGETAESARWAQLARGAVGQGSSDGPAQEEQHE
jgi:TPR repeat protein